MWIKRTESEIDNEERLRQRTLKKYKVRNLILVFFGSLLFSFIVSSTTALTSSGRFVQIPGYPLNIEEYINSISQFIFFSLGFAVTFFIIALFGYKNIFSKRKSTTYICDRCQKVKTIRNKMISCTCGGKSYSIDDYKWIDN